MDLEGLFFDQSDFEITDRILGQGAFGKVYIAKNIEEDKEYAAKIISTDGDFDGKKQMLLMRESMILHKLNHPAILKLIGINFQSFLTLSKLEPTIITEYLPNGSLGDILKEERTSGPNKKWNLTQKCITILGIANAMKYLHQNNIIHRDLKPENILMDENFNPKVADFGLSRCFPEALTNSMQIKLTASIGTPLYMAPELHVGDEEYGLSVDVFAFALITYEILTGKRPYEELGKITTFNLGLKVINGYRPKFTNNVPKKMVDLISRCWSHNSEDRPTLDEIYQILSNDLSYFGDDIDKDKVHKYIGKLSLFKAEKKEEKEIKESKENYRFVPNQNSIDDINKCYMKMFKALFEKVDDLSDIYISGILLFDYFISLSYIWLAKLETLN